MDTCRILLVDDHKLLMEGVRSLLAPHPDLRVVGMASNGEEALRLTALHTPHILIMDISMPSMNGVEAARAVRELCPSVQVIIYTMHDDQRFLLELIQTGIAGHVLKGDPPSTLLQAIDSIRRGGVFFSGHDPSRQLTALMREHAGIAVDDGVNALSPREKEIFRLLADGQSVRNIAEHLHISPRTVESHKYNLLTKLQVNTLSDLTKIAIRHGLIQL